MVVGASDRDPVWLAATQAGPLMRFVMRPMDLRFHDGIAGIGLFYAALFAISGRRADRELAMRCVRAIDRASARGNGRLLEDTIGLNGLRGCAGLVYAVSRIGRLLGSDEAIELARRLARKLEPQTIRAKGGEYCIVLGLAGTVLALLALYEQTAEPHLLEVAAECGGLLVSGREVDPHTGLRVWPTLASPGRRRVMGTGFAHGSSGICVALASLYRHHAADVLLEAIQEAREFEDRLFSANQSNWYDESPPSESVLGNRLLMRAWCHGATGIVMSRVALGDLPGMAFSGREIDLAEPRQRERQQMDQLCCGRLGFLELLVIAGVKLGNAEYVARGERLARAIIDEANDLGGFAPLRDPHVFIPGLFHGRAGIGYQLLRTAFPGNLPSVLLVE
jgi:lantibiotic modifying enzyme